MRTFLETHINRSKSFVLYGNIDDKFISPDLVVKNFEQYLVTLLKSRGYRYVIFYGSGARGAYCLDGASARFFFKDNENLPPVPVWDGSEQNASADAQSQTERPARSSVEEQYENEITNNFVNFDDDDDDDYAPGDRPSPAGGAPDSNGQANAAAGNAAPAPSPVVCYEKKNFLLKEFLQLVHSHLENRKNKIAVIFYNFQTINLNEQILRDYVTYIMEVDDRESVCLFCMPSESDNNALVTALSANGLQSKFLHSTDGGGSVPNPINCVRICQPGTDEIVDLLRYFAIVGTENHHKVTFSYNQLEQLADRILSAIAGHLNQYREDRGNLKDIIADLSEYIDANCEGSEPLELTPETIDKIWKVTRNDGEALRDLNKRGWEAVYDKVNVALSSAEAFSRKNRPSSLADIPADQGVGRVEVLKTSDKSSRPPIPNFLLLGPPGVGKSTIARKIGHILQENGILKKGHTHEVGKSDLVNSFVAGIPGQTLRQVDIAEEGVLLIDEIHQIGVKDGGANNEGSGRDIISTLNHAVTSPNRHFCLIGTGYKNEMEPVFDLDPGFRDRFTYIIEIDSYTPDILFNILVDMIKKTGYEIDPDLLAEKKEADTRYIPLMCMVQRIYDERDREKFRNAAVMSDIADYAIGILSDNNKKTGSDSTVITMDCFFNAKGWSIDKTWFKPNDVAASLDTIMQMLDERFVGMKKAKNAVRKIGNRLLNLAANNRDGSDLTVKPMLIVGNAGTGKSEFAKMLPMLLYHYHVIGSSRPMIISANEIFGTRTSGVKEQANALVKKAQAQKAYLFIDECNALTVPHSGGTQIVQALLKPITDSPEKPFVLAMALYPSHLEDFYALATGLRRRFEVIELEDYTGEELFEIFRRMAAKEELRTDSDTDNILRQVMRRAYSRRTEDSGNGGFVENLLEKMADNKNNRCIENGIPLNSAEAHVLVIEDIPEELRRGLEVEEPTDVSGRLNRLLDNFSHEVVGMENVKQALRLMAIDVEEAMANGQDPDDIHPRSIILVGNSGVGKTKVAEMIPSVYENFGVLRSAEPVRINAASIKGESEIDCKIAEARSKRAMLFVDEAHNLISDQEHLKVWFRKFLAPVTDSKNPLFVCFAVYPSRLDKFLAMDDGSNRYQIIRIDDYNGEELLQIYNIMAEKQKLTTDEEAMKILRKVFENAARNANETSGNGRYVQNYLEKLNHNRKLRCKRENIPFNESRSRVITSEDIPEDDLRLFTPDTGSKLDRLTRLKNTIKNERVGFPDLKEYLIRRVDTLIFAEKYPEYAMEMYGSGPGHFFFMGKPGTGKTTCADFLAKYLFEMGLILDPVPKIIKASDLMGMYLGHSEQHTKQQLSSARGKLLMIDEAYALTANAATGNEYKSGIVNEIIGTLDSEDFRKNTCVVFAGYEQDLRELYEANEGFKSRVTEIKFDDFTLDELVEILRSMLRDKGIVINAEAEPICKERLEAMMPYPGFANGRTVRRFCDVLCERRQSRCLREDYKQGDHRVVEILAEDIPEMYELEKLLNL